MTNDRIFSGATTPTAIEQDGYDPFISAHRFTEVVNTLKIRVEYDANNNPVYVGHAPSGLDVSTDGWVIWKLTYDANGNFTDKDIFGSQEGENANWTDRATYTYS